MVITKERELFLDGDLVSQSQAGVLIRQKAAKEEDLQMVISADKKLPYGEVVAIIDFVKGSGVKTFALNIEKEVQAAR